MNNENIFEISRQNLIKANQIIAELRIKEIWESLDSECNLVGSVKSGLLMEHLDIDFHTYSKDFSIEKSFKAIGLISQNPRIREVTYRNLLDADDMCLEWHLSYQDDQNRIWVIDMMHIKNESPYAGMIERVTEKIMNKLTDEKRRIILEIKHDISKNGDKVQGIDIYQAVFDEGVRSYEELKLWRSKQPENLISMWEPK